MVRQRKHDRNKPRPWTGDRWRRLYASIFNEDLRKWLQSKGAARGGRQRIERLADASVRLAQLAPHVSWDLLTDDSVDKGGQPYLENLAKWNECGQLAATIDRLLRRYKAIQQVHIDGDSISVGLDSDSPQGSDAYSEFEIVTHIVHLLEKGELAKLRKCECGSYFFARSSIVRFCSEKCRTAYWENSEVRKEQKRKKAQEYYRLHKTKNTK